MRQNFTVIAAKRGDWWIGWVQEVAGVNAQEHTREVLIDSLREALAEAVEMDRP